MAQYDVGHIISVPFGGIFSSQDPNYLVGDEPVCGKGFERHSVGSNPIAELSYCIGLGSIDTTLKDIIPPGSGSNLEKLLDFYPLHEFDNGTKIGIRMNPFDKSSYHEQITNMANILQNITSDDNKLSNSYFLKWIKNNKKNDNSVKKIITISFCQLLQY